MIEGVGLKKSSFLNKLIILLIVLIIIIAIILGINLYNNKVIENTYLIKLNGLETITIYEDEKYIDPGYIAYDVNNKIVTDLVTVDSNLNTNVVGSYKIIYSINNKYQKNEVIRIVNVISNPIKDIDFRLNGESHVNVNLNDTYNELGFVCIDKNNNDCSSNVTVEPIISTNKIGVYTINYKLKIASKEKVLTRTVEVVGDRYEYSLDKTNVVNTDVTIQFRSNINDLNYIVKPDGTTVEGDVVDYVVSSNGNYKFLIVDKDNVSEEVIVSVNNIDKVSPTGTCTSYIDGNVTTYNVVASDNNKIIKYVHGKYQTNSYNTGTFSINARIENSSVLVYDEASNYATIPCKDTYAYIGPNGKGKISEYTSNTLKYWVEKPASNYYIAHIWMADPYNQMKTALPSTYGTLETIYDIMTTEISKKGYANKGLVAVNGGAIVNETFDSRLYRAIPAWKYTSVTPIVIHDGKIIRNFTNQSLPQPQYTLYGLGKDGKLKAYDFTNDISRNQQIANTIVNDGIKYTYGFTPVLVRNGKAIVGGQGTASRNSLGQIDQNNFVIIIGKNLNFSFLSQQFVNLNCHTAFNLDGGGSINMFYKSNTNSLQTVYKVSRKLSEALYFVEK